jgi:hypothetical protein
VSFQYHAAILEQLASHGIRPTSATDPAFVRVYLSDLYRYEIRQLKARLLANAFPRGEYAGRVRELRGKYVLLSTSPERWGIRPPGRSADPTAARSR